MPRSLARNHFRPWAVSITFALGKLPRYENDELTCSNVRLLRVATSSNSKQPCASPGENAITGLALRSLSARLAHRLHSGPCCILHNPQCLLDRAQSGLGEVKNLQAHRPSFRS